MQPAPKGSKKPQQVDSDEDEEEDDEDEEEEDDEEDDEDSDDAPLPGVYMAASVLCVASGSSHRKR